MLKVGNPTYPGDDTQRKALMQLLGIGLAGAGVGAGTRAIVGLNDMMRQQVEKRKPAQRPAVVEVGVPEVKEDLTTPVPVFRPKLAQFRLFDPPPAPAPGPVGPPGPTGLDRLLGRLNVKPEDKPWFLPGLVGAAGLGLYGGYKGVGAIANRMQKSNREDELERAKEEYRKALVEQYSADNPNIKHSAAQSELGKDLDELYGLCKTAQIGAPAPTSAPDEPSPLVNKGVGAYATLAALLAGTSGLATYSWAKSRSPEERLARAIQQRERLRWATRPPEIYAVAKPSPVRLQQTPPAQTYSPGTEEDEETVRKVAEAKEIAALYKP